MPCRADARAAVHVEPDIALVGDLRLAGVDADANADRARREAGLDLLRCRHCIRGTGERAEERVALGVDLDTAMLSESAAHELAVLGECVRVRVSQLVEQLRRAFDVAEEKGDGAGRQVGHCYIRSIVFVASRSSAWTASSRCSSFVSSSFVCERPRRLWTKSMTVGMPARETSAASWSGPLGRRCEVPATSRIDSSASSISSSSKRIGSMFQIRSHSTSTFAPRRTSPPPPSPLRASRRACPRRGCAGRAGTPPSRRPR